METKINIFEIDSNYIEELKKWGIHLMNEVLDEAIMSLKEENCLLEEVRLFEVENKFFIHTTSVSNFNMKIIKGPDSDLNKKHRELLKKIIIKPIESSLVYKIQNM